MRLLTTLAATFLAAMPTVAKISPTRQVTCLEFHQVLDGSWHAYHPLTIGVIGKKGRVHLDPNVGIRPGQSVLGLDLASLLNELCK